MSKQANKPAPATVLSFNATALTEAQQRTLFNLEQRDVFVRAGRESGKADKAAKVSAKDAATVFAALWTREGFAGDWTTMDARVLPGVAKEWHTALLDGLKADGHPAPNMVWKRIRGEGVKPASAGGGDGGDGDTDTVESAREKVRRLTEKDIQSMYSRIKKAQDVDRDVLSLIPKLVDMAKSIGMTLKEPE